MSTRLLDSKSIAEIDILVYSDEIARETKRRLDGIVIPDNSSSAGKMLESYLSDALFVVKAQSESFYSIGSVSVDDLKQELPFLFGMDGLWPNVLHDQKGHLVLHWLWGSMHVRAVRVGKNEYSFEMWSGIPEGKSEKVNRKKFMNYLAFFFVAMKAQSFSSKGEWQPFMVNAARKARIGY